MFLSEMNSTRRARMLKKKKNKIKINVASWIQRPKKSNINIHNLTTLKI